MYIPEAYPKMLYRGDGTNVIVANEAEHEALGEGYYESPAEIPAAAADAAADETDTDVAQTEQERETEPTRKPRARKQKKDAEGQE